MSEVSSTVLSLHSRAVLETQGIVFFFFLDRPLPVKIFFYGKEAGAGVGREGGGGRGGREERNLENRLKTEKIVDCTHTVSGFILVCFT